MGWRATVAAALAVGGLLAAPSTGDAIATRTAEGPEQSRTLRMIVQSDGDAVRDVRRATADLGGEVVATQAALGTMVVDVPVGTANRLRSASGVRAVTPDGQVQLQTGGFGPTGATGDMPNVARQTGATRFWEQGHTGKGVDVALLDSGVVPVEGLLSANKLVIGPDLTFEAARANLEHLDTFGHGTHMAGIIAGRDGEPGEAADDGSRFVGMAPGARIVSLKLADAQGKTTIAQVLVAIDWVVRHAHDDGLNIRVLNLSFAGDPDSGRRLDLLEFAAEVAWSKGIVVVAAAGNQGSTRTGLASPASSPGTLAVGGLDTQGTDDTGDDRVASWSQRGDASRGLRGPDLVAPGSSIVSLRAKGSFIDSRFASGVMGERFFRGSGTSQSTAVVSGAAALLLSQRPELSPDQVRDVLRRSARPVAGASGDAQGAGSLNLAAAYDTPSRAVPTTAAAVRAGAIYDRLSDRLSLVRERYGVPELVRGGWTGATWAGATWAGDHWAGATWAGATWAGATWAGATWAGATWAGDHWSGATWAGATWAGATWAGNWAGAGGSS
jgi:serine protease AprX